MTSCARLGGAAVTLAMVTLLAGCADSSGSSAGGAEAANPRPATPTRATAESSGPSLPRLPGHLTYRQFTDSGNTRAALMVSRADGTHPRQITHPGPGVIDENPAWSPDGRTIAFTRNSPCAGVDCITSEIYIVHRDGSGLRQLTHDPRGIGCGAGARNACNSDPAWSPDGKRLVYNHAQGRVVDGSIAYSWLKVMDADGTHVGDFLPRPRHPYTYEDGGPCWSKGGIVAFQRTIDASNTHSVFSARDDGTHVRRLIPWRLQGGDHPACSADGRYVAFHSHADIDLNSPSSDVGDVFVIDLAHGTYRRVTHNPAGTRYGSLTWSPRGRYLVAARFPGSVTTQPDLFLIDTTSGSSTPLTTDSRWQSQPDWTRS